MSVSLDRKRCDAKRSRGSASFRRCAGATIFALLFAIAEARVDYEPIIKTRFGKIRGKFSMSLRGRPVANFLGIPYAEPPIGDLRFKSPQPWTRTWDTVYDATEDGPMCFQHDVKNWDIIGSEDCLYLNVFTPVLSGRRDAVYKLPVMVHVHGGAFNRGSSSSRRYAPDYLMDQDIILVTLNYRLNVFGFFSTADKVSPGNYGLKDIKLALEWIQQNIDSFLGDPQQVTLSGQSAGASAVHILALTEKTEGLFHRYILQSGSALATWAVHPPPAIRQSSLALAGNLDCPAYQRAVEKVTETTTEQPQTESAQKIGRRFVDNEELSAEEEVAMMECLRSLNGTSFLEVDNFNYVWWENPYCTFGPTLEEEAEDAVLTTHPLTVIKKHAFRDIPWIVGFVEDEGLVKSLGFYTDQSNEDEMTEYFHLYLPYLLEYHEVLSNTTAFTKAVENFYFNGNVTGKLTRNITEVVGDALLTWPTYQALKYQSQHMNSSTYAFLFSYEGTFSTTFSSGIPIHYGVAHADDLNYLFPLLNNAYSGLLLHNTESDIAVINIMTEMWANFVKEGVPSAWSVPEWPDYRGAGEFLRIGIGTSSEIVVETELFPERMAFWEELTANTTWYGDALEAEAAQGEKDDNGSNGSVLVYENAASISLFTILLVYVLH